jgi:hypothetical protein
VTPRQAAKQCLERALQTARETAARATAEVSRLELRLAELAQEDGPPGCPGGLGLTPAAELPAGVPGVGPAAPKE